MPYATGQCFCGKVTFKVQGPAKWAGHCHCRQCQQLHGAAFVTWTGFKTADYAISDPGHHFTIFNSGRAERGFCNHCGASFFFRYKTEDSTLAQWKEYVYFTQANLNGEPDVLPTAHIHTDTKAPWLTALVPIKEG